MHIKLTFLITIFCIVLFSASPCWARKHKLEIKNDNRKYIALSTFGFYKGGILDVKLVNFHASPLRKTDVFGFSLDRTLNDAMSPYLDIHQERCLLETPMIQPSNAGAVFFTMDFVNNVLRVNCTSELKDLHIYRNASLIPAIREKRDSLSDHSLLLTRHKRHVLQSEEKERSARSNVASLPTCSELQIPITVDEKKGYYTINFVIYIAKEKEEGLYNLYFHSCPNYDDSTATEIGFTMEIMENNHGNFLSAGEMPLPALYFMMSLLCFLSGCFWVFILVKSKHPVFKIHYLMAVLVYLKSLSLLFHAVNFHFIQTKGEHVAAWAILYYITHLLKGAVLFITIVLIGTGWTFIKYLLSEKDKKIFMIVIPLQVLANVAKIIIDETEEGDKEHRTWLDVFMLVDLLCCCAILFPVVWSIRHLQEASHTDGKAAINLRKLKLFRHFYIMIVCYIYFTRIIVYLLQMTVSFQYEWLDEMFREMVTYVFFVMTGYKFRPASANPYFQVNNEDNLDDDDDEMDVVYVDDTFVLFNGTFRQIENMKRYMNLINSQIQFTLEVESERMLNLLDLTVIRSDVLQYRIFRKPTTTVSTIHAESHHPIAQKMATFNSFIHRALSIPLSKEDFQNELNIIKYIAVENGYRSSMVDKILKKRTMNKQKPTKEQVKKHFRSIEYGAILPSILTNTLRKIDVTMSYRTSNNIKNITKPKKTTPLEQKSGIYRINCGECECFYIGQTGRQFKKRYKKHLPSNGIAYTRSNYARHIIEEDHSYSNFETNFQPLHICRKSKQMDAFEEYEIYKAQLKNPEHMLNDQLIFKSNLMYDLAKKFDTKCKH